MNKSFEKQAKVTPTGYISPHIRPLLPQLRWYVWKYKKTWNHKRREYDWPKPVRSPKTLETFKWNDTDGSWEKNHHLFGSFEEALRTYRNNSDLQGIGTLIESDRKISIGGKDYYLLGVEIDDCLDAENREITVPWVKDLVTTADTYTEISPSSDSIHILALGERPTNSYSNLPEGFTEGIDAHVYGGGVGKRHAITFTGVPLYDKPLTNNIQSWLDTTLPRKSKKASSKTKRSSEFSLTEEDLKKARKEAIKRIAEKREITVKEALRECKEARLSPPDEKLETLRKVSRERFKKLWAADKEVFNGDSQHEADQALCLMLASATGLEPTLMDELFRKSKLYREDKWEQEQYRLLTLNAALEECDRIYTPPRRHLAATKASRDIPMGKPLLSDVESINKLMQIKGGRFTDLWHGDTRDYETVERAHLALCSDLAFITQNDEESIDRLFRNTILYDYQWDDESYRTKTIRASFQQNIYTGEPNPKERVRRPILDTLEDIRLNLAYECKNGLHACYIYYALIRKGLYGQEIPVYIRDHVGERWIHETDVLVHASNIDLQLYSGVYSNGNFTEGARLLEKEGLVEIPNKGGAETPTTYILKSPLTIAKEIVPYPPGFIGTYSDCRRFIYGVERIEHYGKEPEDPHPVEAVSFRRNLKRIPKKHFRSSLNSMAARDKNIKDILNTRLDVGDPEGFRSKGYKDKNGKWVQYLEPHPPLALSPPFNSRSSTFIYGTFTDSSDAPMDEQTRWKLVHMKGMSPKKKFVVEQIDHGRCSVIELMKFFDEDRKDNFKSGIIKPLVQMGLIEEFEDPVFGLCYQKTLTFAQTVDEAFENSGSRIRYEEVAHRFAKKRADYQEKLRKWEESRLRSEEEFVRQDSTTKDLDELKRLIKERKTANEH